MLSLLSQHMPGSDVEGRYEWLYERNPHGKAFTVIAFDPGSGAPMGLTSLFPRQVLVRGALRIGSIGGDGFVCPEFRRRGVATTLHQACLAAMTAGEVEFMYGAPVPANLKALVRAGSRVVGSLQRFTRPALLQRSLRVLSHFAPQAPPRLEPLLLGDARAVDRVWEQAVDDQLVLPVRDAPYFAWRFGQTPSGAQRPYVVIEGGEPIALCVLEEAATYLGIVEFIAPRNRLSSALWATARACGTRALTMLVHRDGPLREVLLENGFFPREAKPFQVLAPSPHPQEAELLDPTRWYYTWGDGDTDSVLQAV